jgi:glycosyltransferase involved in cell wall biosynthesis
MREMLRYSLSYSASMWIWQLRPLVNPLVVGRILGPEAVAFVSLAMRFVDVLTFVKSIIWRLSIAALGKIQRELDRLRRGLEEGMAVQVVAVGTALAVFAQVASWVVPIVFGSKWGPALGLYPFVALGCLVNAPFSQQSSVLNILKQNRSVAIHNAIHITIFAATCAALVPSFGLRGYAVAEIVALSSYVLLHHHIAAIFSISYTQSAPWLFGFIPPLFAVFVSLPWGILLWLPLLMVALWPAQRRQINTYVCEMKMRFARAGAGHETTVDRSGALVAHEGVPQVLVSHVDNHVIANTNSDGVPNRFATIHRPKAHSHDLDTPVENGDRIQTPLALAPLPERPLVSVLIANYNYAHFIGQAIESVLSQTYSHVEVVVCDDGSTDDSVNVISRYAARDARVRWVHRPNGGMAAAWNTAYKMSSGDIVCTLDADDTFLPRKVELVVQRFCDHPQSGLVIHSLMVVDDRDDEVQTIPILPKIEEGWIADAVTRRGGRWRSVQTSGLSFRRDVCRYVFPIVESTFRRGPDGFVGTLLPLLTEVSVVDEVLARYRVHSLNDLGSFGFDARAGRSVVDMVVASTNGVNARLAELGLESQRIDVNLNTGHSEYAFMLGLAEGRPQGVLIGEYRSLVAALLACDLYGLPSKLLKIIIYGVAVSLPDRLRRSWISWVLGCSRLKQRAIRFNRALTVRRGHA